MSAENVLQSFSDKNLVYFMKSVLTLLGSDPVPPETLVTAVNRISEGIDGKVSAGDVIRELTPMEANIVHLDVSCSIACTEFLLKCVDVIREEKAERAFTTALAGYLATKLSPLFGSITAGMLRKIEGTEKSRGTLERGSKNCLTLCIHNDALCIARSTREEDSASERAVASLEKAMFNLENWRPPAGKPN